jgi:antitoxin PrlF
MIRVSGIARAMHIGSLWVVVIRLQAGACDGQMPSGYSKIVGKSETRRVAAMGVPAAKIEHEPLVSARVKVRPKAQLTLPEEIRRALHIGEGDEVEFAVHDDGTITVRGYVSIPTDQAWFFTPQWLAGEREADEEITAGRGTAHESADDMFAYLDASDAGT